MQIPHVATPNEKSNQIKSTMKRGQRMRTTLSIMRTGEMHMGKCTCICIFDVYGGFQRKEQMLAVAIYLEDAYNRVQCKLLMDLPVQYGVSLTLAQWIAGALLERALID